ncbi:hypothetical protein BDD12DRAFT_752363, partial [Trichophaea hybrida]
HGNGGLLDSVYGQVIASLQNQDEGSKALAMKTLAWLVKAKRALILNELRVAVLIEEGRYELDELDSPHWTTLLDVCSGLVMISEKNNTVHLFHFTIQVSMSFLLP